MIPRKVRIQIIVFGVLAALGISYVSLNYIGLGQKLFNGTYTVSADFPDSGGIFSNAEVTYRGVQVGRVGQLHLLSDGVRVDLVIRNNAPAIPADVIATVTDRSAVGEQYVDLAPRTDGGAALKNGDVIGRGRTKIPVATETLLVNLDRLVNSVDENDLRTVVDELGTALEGRGPDLQALIDYGDALLSDATEHLPETITLINAADTVLKTQVDKGSAIQSFSRDLALVTRQLKTSDPDLRKILANAPASVQQVTGLIKDNRTDLGILLANTVTVGQVFAVRNAQLREVFIAYPLVTGGGFTVAPGDGTAHLGLVLNLNDPQVCAQGYESTDKRVPQDTSDIPANQQARCTLPTSSTTNVRGSAQIPVGPVGAAYPGSGFPADGPGAPNSGKAAAARSSSGTPTTAPTTAAPQVGSTGGGSSVLGDRSWVAPLLRGVS